MSKRNHIFPQRVGFYVGALALGATALLLPACNNPQEISEGQGNVTTEDIAEADATDDVGLEEDAMGEDAGVDETLIGQTVTVRSPIQETLGTSGLVLETDTDPIPVINVSGVPFTPPLGEETPIQVTGEVVQLVVADIEQEYGLDLDEELYVDYEQQLAIVAESLAPAPTPEELAEDATPYYGQRIAVEGEAKQLISPTSFALYEEGWIDDVGLVVISATPNPENPIGEIQEGETVTVTGTVRPFDINMLQAEYGLDWDEQLVTEFQERYTDRPVIIADGIYPSALDE